MTGTLTWAERGKTPGSCEQKLYVASVCLESMLIYEIQKWKAIYSVCIMHVNMLLNISVYINSEL